MFKLFLLGSLVISAGAGDIIAVLLGSKRLAATPLVALAAWRVLFHPFHKVCSAALVARGRVRSKFYVDALAAALRVALVTAAVFTTSLSAVVVATLGALAGGAIAYIIALRSELAGAWGRFVGGLARIAAATIVAGVALERVGLGWRAAANAASGSYTLHGLALLHLGIEATVVAGIYALVLLVLWRAFGRPEGPESTAISLLRAVVPVRRLLGSASHLVSRSRR